MHVPTMQQNAVTMRLIFSQWMQIVSQWKKK